jgi:hypothetical protein
MKRRRQRWSAFQTPFITLGSLVISIGLLMFLYALAVSVCRTRSLSRKAARARFPMLLPPAISQISWTRHEPVFLDRGCGSSAAVGIGRVASFIPVPIAKVGGAVACDTVSWD